MGYTNYSSANLASRRLEKGYATKSIMEIFTQQQMNNAMNPNGMGIRESRDSKEHPNSLAIIIALDVTGSMGAIPHFLVKEGLDTIMAQLIQKGIKDPQVLFLAIGDHECDSAPLQVSQFESGDELLEYWLTSVYLEGGGGGNEGESYLLAWYIAGNYTAIDCFEKRGQKGFLFTIGDEFTLMNISGEKLKSIIGNSQNSAKNSALVFLDKAREKYHVCHLHLKQGCKGFSEKIMGEWKQLMGDNLFIVENKEESANKIVEIIIENISKNSVSSFVQEIML